MCQDSNESLVQRMNKRKNDLRESATDDADDDDDNDKKKKSMFTFNPYTRLLPINKQCKIIFSNVKKEKETKKEKDSKIIFNIIKKE